MYHVFRLKKGQDLKLEIEKYILENKIKAGIILSCVGCIYEVNIRLANGSDTLSKKDNYEIVSMTGTLSPDGVHLHISLSDTKGLTIGGHLKDGCLVNTTAEICILELDDFNFKREFDESTGYKELVIERIGDINEN